MRNAAWEWECDFEEEEDLTARLSQDTTQENDEEAEPDEEAVT